MNTPAAPNRPDEITPDWVGSVLTNGLNAKVLVAGVEVEVIGGGFLGTVARIAIDTPTPGAPSSLVAKFAHPDPATRAEVWDANIYQCEARFYRDLQTVIPLESPAAWFVDTDRDRDQHLIVIDDLSSATMYDQLAGCPADRAFDVVADLATLHGRFWGDDRGPASMLRSATEDDSWFELSASGIPAMLERDDLTADQRTVTENYADIGPEVTRLLDTHRTVIHADARIENIFFRADGSRVWIDWDGIQLGGAGFDLAYFISQSLSTEVRREIEADLLAHYVKTLGRSDFTTDEAWRDYRRGIVAGWAVGLAVVGVYGAKDDQASRLVAEGIARIGAALEDHDAAQEFV